MSYPAPDSTLFDGYITWLKLRGRSQGTIANYLNKLQILSAIDDIEAYLANEQLPNRRNKITAYRSYCKFLMRKLKTLTRDDYMDILDTFKTKINRNHQSERKYSIPQDEWKDYIRKAPNYIIKMGMWIGFNFGMRKNEIIHLRIKDIDFKRKEILIREHKQTKHQDFWHPKHRVHRNIPFSDAQAKVFEQWIHQRPTIDHPYLLYHPRLHERPIKNSMFYYWCKAAGISPHVLRYSFATHYYNKSKDVKLISDLLGHSSVSTTSEYLQLGHQATMSKARQLFER